MTSTGYQGQSATRDPQMPEMASKRDPYAYSVALILAGLLLTVSGQRQGKMLTCVCTTTDCQMHKVNTCSTIHKCYTQLLERDDGSGPIVRGCITNKSPLLCENRPPATSGNWPLLHCCNYSMCNEEATPTQPAWLQDKINVSSAIKLNQVHGQVTTDAQRGVQNNAKIISPIYISVLVVGVLLLLIIAAVAIAVLRRPSIFYRREFSIDRRGYMKSQDLTVSRLRESNSSRNEFCNNDSKAILAT
uniref:Activin types I and II receptor domain-containing protein n=1 Tax=Strigamia maritima TaxID=126957 RepID=T1JAZ2_STRMM